ncbi:hypothetical protein OHT76_43645 [Streptomyces sp. NBC_00287]|uniref:hypothetical protein n=1 Tax=Streptomyces sp. NBC_00287 TaxID=2975702 RepID=UPI002E2D0EF5|nr:hypothetical protein [Streptomyces sp. NBC_00287]
MRITPNDMQGRVGGVVMLLVSGASSLGALGTGYLLEAVGSRDILVALLAVLAVLALVAAAVFSRAGAAREDRADSIEPLDAAHTSSGRAVLPGPGRARAGLRRGRDAGRSPHPRSAENRWMTQCGWSRSPRPTGPATAR